MFVVCGDELCSNNARVVYVLCFRTDLKTKEKPAVCVRLRLIGRGTWKKRERPVTRHACYFFSGHTESGVGDELSSNNALARVLHCTLHYALEQI